MLGEAIAAVDRPAFCGLEGYFRLLAAVTAGCLVHFARAHVSGGPSESTVSHYFHSLELGFPVLGQAVPAVYGSAFCWLEGYFALLAAVGAGCLVHFAGAHVSGGPSESTVTHCYISLELGFPVLG